MSIKFKELIDEVFYDFFKKYHIKYDDDVLSDELKKELVYYRSKQYRICFYRSLRDGEINCLLSLNFTTNYVSNPEKWHFINRLTSTETLTIEELISNVSFTFKSDREELINIMNTLDTNFANIYKTLLKLAH